MTTVVPFFSTVSRIFGTQISKSFECEKPPTYVLTESLYLSYAPTHKLIRSDRFKVDAAHVSSFWNFRGLSKLDLWMLASCGHSRMFVSFLFWAVSNIMSFKPPLSEHSLALISISLFFKMCVHKGTVTQLIIKNKALTSRSKNVNAMCHIFLHVQTYRSQWMFQLLVVKIIQAVTVWPLYLKVRIPMGFI